MSLHVLVSGAWSVEEAHALADRFEREIEAALPGAATEPVGLGDRVNMVFSGTAVARGRGRAVVTATGMATEMGTSRACSVAPASSARRCSGRSIASAACSGSP